MPGWNEDARAKVNLTLRVIGRRADGYHDLESVVAFADCADHLSLAPGPELRLAISGALAAACGDPSDNLVIKAATALCERVPGLQLGDFRLDKRLPVAAGIGGGSADAAAALRLLAQANKMAIDDVKLIEVARQTGADVPVCLASRACVMTGVGETLTPLVLPELPCVMVNPRVAVATKEVFAALGLRQGELRVGAVEVLTAPSWPGPGAPPDRWIDALAAGSNDLQAPALRVQPVIGEVLAALAATGGARLVRMSGSGATCFAIYDDAGTAHSAAQQIRSHHPPWWVHAGVLN